jgi:hypothetical protein
MPQDQITGAAGNDFGRKTAPMIARSIGATMLGSNSNEASYHGSLIVIKCAARNTNSVGVTYRMLERLHAVAGAFQQIDGSFEVILLPVTIFSEEMRPTRSLGASARKVGLVSRGVFESKGTHIRTVRL